MILSRAKEHFRRGGARELTVAALASLLRRPLPVRVRVPGTDRGVTLRLRTSDLWTFDEIFGRREYEVPLPPDTRTIIDAGANIGLASVYFAMRFPQARILALEPEPENFHWLCRNVAPFRGVVPVRAALWSEDTSLALSDPGRGAWAFQVGARTSERPNALVEGRTLPTLLREHGMEGVDVLKVDIEGAEAEVFAASGAWIEAVRSIVIELHEGAAPGCSDGFDRATSEFPHRWRRGENLVVAREAHPWP